MDFNVKDPNYTFSLEFESLLLRQKKSRNFKDSWAFSFVCTAVLHCFCHMAVFV